MPSFGDMEQSRTRGERVELFLVHGAEPTLESLTQSLAIGPGTGEFVLGTTKVNRAGNPDNWARGLPTFIDRTIADLQVIFPRLRNVTLRVAWFGSDLRAHQCRIRPKVESSVEADTYPWRVGSVDRASAETVGRVTRGGTPADRSVYEAIMALRAAGYRVTVYPMLVMDIPPSNGAPDPYGGTGQTAYPWRGRVTCHPAPGVAGTVDKRPQAANQISSFFGTTTQGHFGWNAANLRVTYDGPADDWGYRRFVLHLATIAQAAGAGDFCIGSELAGVTQVRDSDSSFPAVTKLKELAGAVRAIMPTARLGYAADWTEYHSYRPDDGSGDVFFNLDPLWADANIDFVGIDWSAPLADWRARGRHIDRKMGYATPYDVDYLRGNVQGGEGFDWEYTSPARRDAQRRRLIVDRKPQAEHWVFRQKAVEDWWLNEHHHRPGGNRGTAKTQWNPRSKPVRFMFGYRAIDLAMNGVREESAPPFSNGSPDEIAQRTALEVSVDYWTRRRPAMIDQAVVGYYDPRPHDELTRSERRREEYETSAALNGRVWAGYGFYGEIIPDYGFTDAETTIDRKGVVYEPVPVRRSDFSDTGTLDKSTLTVTLKRGTPLDSLFIVHPPSRGANLTIRQGHPQLSPEVPIDFPVAWTGRILSAKFSDHEVTLTAEPLQAMLGRPGLRRNYQVSCPHVLYGEDCRANRSRVAVRAQVVGIKGQTITLDEPGIPEDPPPRKYSAGLIEWTAAGRGTVVRTIVEMLGRNRVVIRGYLQDLQVGDMVTLLPGCNRQQNDCRNIFANILNFGGQPGIPNENPFSAKNQYY